MKIAIRYAIALAIFAGISYAVAGPEPSVGIYWYDNTDPTFPPGMSAPLNQLLVRTDAPSLYYKSSTAATGWTKIGSGTSSGGTVTSVACGVGLSCAPSPITSAGTISVALTPTSCAPSSAVTGIASNGTGSCTAFTPAGSISGTTNTLAKFASSSTVGNSSATDDGTTFAINGTEFTVAEASGNFAASGTGSIGGALNMNSHLIDNVTNPVSAQDAATKSYVDSSTSGAVSGTANFVSKFTGAHTVGNSSVSDDGTTWALGSVFSIVEASGNFSSSGTGSIGGALNMNSHLIDNVTNPVSAQDAATKSYVDSSTSGAVNGTANTVTKFTGSHAVGNSSVTDDGTTWAIGSVFTIAEASGTSAIAGRFSLSASITPTAFSGTRVDNYAPTGLSTTYVIDQQATSNTTITGLVGQVAGTQINFRNISSSTGSITFSNADANSSVGNRFTMPGAVNWTLPPGSSMLLRYNGTDWRMVASTTTDFPSLTLDTKIAVPEIDTTGVISATATSGTVNNWDPAGTGNVSSSFIVYESPTAALTVTGLVAGNAGQVLVVRNTSTTAADVITLNSEASGSTAANRFTLPNGASSTIAAGGSCMLRYSGTNSRWEPIADGCAQSTLTSYANATLTTTDTGTMNDYNPAGLGSATILRLNPGAGLTITGLTGGQDGRLLYIVNVSTTNSVTLNNEAAGSTAANRFSLLGSANTLLSVGTNGTTAVMLLYDGTTSRWRAISTQVTSYGAGMAFTNGLTVSGLNANGGNFTISSATGHISVVGATSPTLSACGSTPSPSIVGSDVAGRVTTGGTATTCTITFAATYTNPPMCIVRGEGTATDPTYTVSATAISMTVDITSTTYDYFCVRTN